MKQRKINKPNDVKRQLAGCAHKNEHVLKYIHTHVHAYINLCNLNACEGDADTFSRFGVTPSRYAQRKGKSAKRQTLQQSMATSSTDPRKTLTHARRERERGRETEGEQNFKTPRKRVINHKKKTRRQTFKPISSASHSCTHE